MTTRLSTAQPGLFDDPATDPDADADAPAEARALPPGLLLHPALIDHATERALLQMVAALPLHAARYKVYTARRRVLAWGARYDFDAGTVQMGSLEQLPPALLALREPLAAFAGVSPADFAHAMVTEYAPGTPLGWHRDAPGYEVIAGVSLAGHACMRWRPWLPTRAQPAAQQRQRTHDVVELELAPRSAYVMRGPARWAWQHSVAPVPALRYSVTMRTLRG
jgi:alkylated DNA repair dioxygenase AlkB